MEGVLAGVHVAGKELKVTFLFIELCFLMMVDALVQDGGLLHMEKTADKWGKNGEGDEWQEQWWEHYDASGKSEKWAHKWCSIDPNTPLDAGHAHVWHERYVTTQPFMYDY